MNKNINSILVIDDNKGDQLLAQLAIEDSQITDKVFFSDNGENAIEFLKDYDENRKKEGEDFPPVLVFLDINMPKMDGFGFLEEYDKIQKLNKYESIVILMVTSSHYPEDIKKSKNYEPVKGYIEKPITEEKIQTLLASLPQLNQD